MWEVIAKSLYFFLPAYMANMAPSLLRKWSFAKKPIHEKIFGSHKTWRGIVVATLAGGITFGIQKYYYLQGFTDLAVIDYGDFSLLLGFIMGFGAIIGDLVKSYYKRKEGIPPGDCWLPWDQLDFVLGGLIFTCFFYVPPAEIAALIFILSPLLHLIVNYIGYLMGVNEKKI